MPESRSFAPASRDWATSRSRGRTRSCRSSCATPQRTRALVRHFYEHGVLVVGLTFPVVPKGSETIRFQVNAAHTEADIAAVLDVLAAFQS